jgi:hypothetical protein
MTERIYGYTETGRPIDEAMIERLLEEAERGYDVDALLSRRKQRHGRPRLGLGPEIVQSLGVDPGLRAEIAALAEARGVPEAEVVDEALRRYVRRTLASQPSPNGTRPS